MARELYSYVFLKNSVLDFGSHFRQKYRRNGHRINFLSNQPILIYNCDFALS